MRKKGSAVKMVYVDGRRLQQLRKHRELSLRALAKLVDYSDGYISQAETKPNKKFSMNFVNAISDLFEVDADKLIVESPVEESKLVDIPIRDLTIRQIMDTIRHNGARITITIDPV